MADADQGATGDAGRAALDGVDLFEMLVETIDDAVWVKDAGGRFVVVNTPCARAIGIAREALPGRTYREAFPHDPAPHTEREDARVFAGETVRRRDAVIAPGGAKTHVFQSVRVPLRDAAGAVVGLLGVGRDVSAMEGARTALDARAEELQTILDTVPAVIWVARDAECAVVQGNRFASELLSVAEGANQSVNAVGAPPYRHLRGGVPVERADLPLERAVRGDPPSDDEITVETVDGRAVTLFGSARALIDADGRPRGAVYAGVDVSARRAAEAEAARADEAFLALSDNLPNLCWIADATGAIYWYNRRWYEYTGTTSAEMEGWGWRSVHDPAVLPDVMERWTGSIASGQPFEMTFPLRGADGVFRPFLTRISPVRDAGGTITRWVGNNVDVSEQEALADRLARSEARFRTVARALPGLLFETSAAGGNTLVNEAFCTYTGLPESELLGDQWLQVIHPDDTARAWRIWSNSVATLEPYEAEYKFRRQDGQWRWHLVRALPVVGADGAVDRWVGTCVDIHARRTLEAELERIVAERTAERDLAWNNARDLLCFINAAGRFTAVNPAWREVLGWNADEMVGRPYTDFVHPDDVPPDGQRLAAALRDDVLNHENRYRDRHGTWHSFIWVTRPTPGGLFAAARDVTGEREQQARLREAEAQLAQMQKLETIGQLTGGVAHDFNNLLTPIVGSLDLLARREGVSARDLKLIDGARQASERARVLVQRLLSFARRQRLESGPVDLGELVMSMRDLIERSIGPRVAVAIEVEAGLPAAEVDANQLELALLNLAVNARDAMPGGGTLSIAAARATPGDAAGLPPGEYVVLSVEDTGEGMDAATIARAVEPFFSTKGVGQGTGLGLSMAHGLAAQSGGRLMIESAPGEGTTITMLLPVAVRAAVAAPAVPEAAAPGRGRVLVVDDEPLVRDTVAEMLRAEGYEVTVAASGEAALAALDGARHELLVTDYLMPGMTGAALARRVLHLRPGTRVLVATGYARLDDPDLDGLTTVAKPFAPGELARAVARALAPARG